MSQRFHPPPTSSSSSSTLHNRDPRHASSALFSTYTGDRSRSTGPGRPSGGSGPSSARASPAAGGGGGGGGGGLYGSGSGSGNGYVGERRSFEEGEGMGTFRAATPNKRGQYSDAVLSSLESQNDDQITVLSGKVQQFKDLTLQIGHEIRSSSALASDINDSFDSTRQRLRGTMGRMLRMAKKTGVGWRVWLGFFAAVVLVFWWVWL
ncbi:MAG: protein transport protein bet1 [Caeruleum heppii]|nr:MAG: protein transport protein bet1 [Caeruleum heppii]